MAAPLLSFGITPVPAQARPIPGPEAPAATLRIFSGTSLVANYYGTGSVRLDAPLCLGSTTGRYRLAVTPAAGFRDLAGAKVQIGLAQGSSDAVMKPVAGSAALYFPGSSNVADMRCADGPNAHLVIELPERAMHAASAGSYFDQLLLEIEAL